jgi:antitoxin ParD1/3/4
MNITLSPELEKMIRTKVKSGRFHSAHEVVHTALLVMDEQDRFQEMKLRALREKIREGMKGPYSPWNVEELKEKARKRFRKS